MSRALFLEDDADVAEVVSSMLEDLIGASVTWVQDAPAALAHISDDRVIELVIVDYWLPGGGSLDVAQAAMKKGIALCFVTGDVAAAERLRGQGFQAIIKPFSVKALRASIRQASRKPGQVTSMRDSNSKRGIRGAGHAVEPDDSKPE